MEVNNFLSKLRFDPTISIGHLGSAVVFIIGGLAAFYSLKEDVSNIRTAAQIRWEQQDKKLDQLELKNKEQDVSMREISVELKQELRSNTNDIKQEFRDLRSDLRKK